MDEFKDSKSSLVADVDCTAGGQDLCQTHGVKGYPTIKWGDPSDMKDYDGGRSFSDLQKFAQENLGPSCGPDNLDLCDADDKATLEKYMAMDSAALDAAISEGDAKVAKVEASFTKKIKKLESDVADANKRIEKEKEKHKKALAAEDKKLGLRFKKAVAAAKKKDEL